MLGKIINFFAEPANKASLALPVRKTIVFESSPEFTCNTYPIYKYLSECKELKKYKFVWLVEDKNKYRQTKKTKYINYMKSAKRTREEFIYRYYMRASKCLIYSNRLLGYYRKDQFSFCLEHGMPIKRSHDSYRIENNCTSCLCVSEFFADTLCEDFVVDKKKLVYAGFPRNDFLYSDRDVLTELNCNTYDKVIIWMPTYRKHEYNENAAKSNIESTATGIPCINTVDEIKTVDSFCRQNNILLILKPHPVQNISVDIQSELTNFKIITNEYLADKNIQLYELIGKTDALITDYSSVYYDYLLCDKPIGLTVDDIEEFTKARGFVYDDPKEVLKGEYINSTDELIAFFDDVHNGIDKYKTARNIIKNKAHIIQDGTSTEKVCDYILKQLK